MIRVVPHLLQVVVFAGNPQALLRVHGPRVRTLARPQKDIFKLVHPRICEEQSVVSLRHEGGTRDGLVALRLKKLQEVLPNLFGGARGIGGGLKMRIHWVVGESISGEQNTRTKLRADSVRLHASSETLMHGRVYRGLKMVVRPRPSATANVRVGLNIGAAARTP